MKCAKQKVIRGLLGIGMMAGFIIGGSAIGVFFGLLPVLYLSFTFITIALTSSVLYVVRRARRRNVVAKRLIAGYCPSCGYDPRRSNGRCPECGEEQTIENRRRWLDSLQG